MCRNIKVLFNFEPPASEDDVQSAALQFVRKLSGFRKPSRLNQVAFDRAVDEISETTERLLESLKTDASVRNREVEANRARAFNEKRFGKKSNLK